MYSTSPVLKAGHLCPIYSFVACLFVSWDRGFLGFFLLLSVCLLVCYTHFDHVHVVHVPVYAYTSCTCTPIRK